VAGGGRRRGDRSACCKREQSLEPTERERKKPCAPERGKKKKKKKKSLESTNRAKEYIFGGVGRGILLPPEEKKKIHATAAPVRQEKRGTYFLTSGPGKSRKGRPPIIKKEGTEVPIISEEGGNQGEG